MKTFQIKRGLKTNLPVLNNGEFAFTTDSSEVFIGSSGGNINTSNNIKQVNLFSNFATKITDRMVGNFCEYNVACTATDVNSPIPTSTNAYFNVLCYGHSDSRCTEIATQVYGGSDNKRIFLRTQQDTTVTSWTEIDTKQRTTTTVSATNGTIPEQSIVKQGDIVTMSLRINIALSSTFTICTIPNGYRPVNKQQIEVYANVSNAYKTLGVMNTDGTIVLYSLDSTARDYIVSCTYLTA